MRRVCSCLPWCSSCWSPAVPRRSVVYDPAMTLAEQRHRHRSRSTARRRSGSSTAQLRRMAQRLSMFTNLRKYALPDPPRWRTHDFEDRPSCSLGAYHAALNYGDPRGGALTWR